MKKNFTLFTFLISMISYGQTTIGRQQVDQYPMNAYGDLTYGLTWLPTSYALNPTKKYPLIIFLHGTGESGTGVGGLYGLINTGLPARIATGFDPFAVSPVDHKGYEFIVCSPQAPGWSYNYNQLKYILPDILRRYRVDPSKIYLTGLSAGGGGVFTCLGSGDANFLNQIAATATSSSAGIDAVNGLTEAQVMANLIPVSRQYGVHVWTVTGDLDFLFHTDVSYSNQVNMGVPAILNKLTIIAGVGHSSWDQQYDSAYRPMLNYYGWTANCISNCMAITAPNNYGSPIRGSGATQDSLNLFEWFLLSQRTDIPPLVGPTANAGINQTITLPSNSVTLSGSGTAGTGQTITSYTWTNMSVGPATIASPYSPSTAVTGLVAGTYDFQLTVTNSAGATATSDVIIVVNPASAIAKYIMVDLYGGLDAYANTQWNNWNVFASTISPNFQYSDGTPSGVSAILSYSQDLVDNSPDYGGGMAPAEVLRHSSYSPDARTLIITGLTPSRTYDMEFYASRNLNENNFTTFDIGQTTATVGTYYNYTNKAAFTNLVSDGLGQIIVNIRTLNSFNYLNGFMITEYNNTIPVSLARTTIAASSPATFTVADSANTKGSSFLVVPNPIKDNFILEINNSHTGKMNIQVVDQSGAIKHSYIFNKDQPLSQVNLSSDGLPAGTYFIRVQIGTWSETRKMLKL